MSLSIKKIVIFVLGVAVLAWFYAANSSSQSKKPSQDTLIVGLQSGYPPFEFMDTQGKIVGFDVEIANRIAEKLQKTLVIKDMEFEGEILSLKQGKIDLIISGMNITSSRLKEIAMVPYHGDGASFLSLIFWEQIPAGVASLEDIGKLSNPTVSVESGAIPEMYISRYPDIIVKSFQGSLSPLMDVKYSKSVASLVERDVAQYLEQQHPEIRVLHIPLAKEEEILGFGIGIKKGNNALLQQVQEIIAELKASGEIEKLEQKWFRGEAS